MDKKNWETIHLQAAVIVQSLYGNNKQMEGAVSLFSVRVGAVSLVWSHKDTCSNGSTCDSHHHQSLKMLM